MLNRYLKRGISLTRRAIRLTPKIIANPQMVPLMRQGVHPEHYSRLNVKWLKEANVRTVLDIGANTGQFTGAARAVLPQAMIYAFEPLPECNKQIASSFADDKRVRVLPFAIGERNAEVPFHQNDYLQSSSVLELANLHLESRPWATQTKPIQVQMRSLDSLQPELELTPNVLVKIDVQGYEDRVLEGGEQVIRGAHIVLVETAFEPLYEGEATFEDLYDTLKSYGFRYAGNLNQANNGENERPIFADAIFLRSL